MSNSSDNSYMPLSDSFSMGPENRGAILLRRCMAFSRAFLGSKSASALLEKYFISDNGPHAPKIIEYGPQWAQTRLPYLGKMFSGRDGSNEGRNGTTCEEYFRLLHQTLELKIDGTGFPPGPEWVVDHRAAFVYGEDESGLLDCERCSGGTKCGRWGAVSVVAWAEFKSIKTGKSWKEKWTCRWSGFDEKGRFEMWEIFPDALSAWVACEEDASNQSKKKRKK